MNYHTGVVKCINPSKTGHNNVFYFEIINKKKYFAIKIKKTNHFLFPFNLY